MDREDVLWKAEKLVRQGRLNLAITEYKRVVDEYPEDWSTANTLGDLYLRAQQTDRAVEQYLRIADHLAQEGFLPKAAALYKKALKIKPSDDHALLQAADIAVRQSLFAEARQHFLQAVTHRRAAGNLAGAAEALMRIAALDPEDLQTRLAAARAVGEAGQPEIAAGELLSLADELEARGRTTEFFAALEEAAQLVPEDAGVRSRVARGLAEHGQSVRARKHARTADDFRDLANVFAASGDDEAVVECLRAVARIDATDAAAAAKLVQTYVGRGDLAAAQPYLVSAAETTDPAQLLLVGEVLARSNRLEEARIALTRLLTRSPHTVPEVVDLGVRLVRDSSSGGLACIESAASVHLLSADFAAAADAYERLLAADPANLTGLMCLVELCVEGALDEQLVHAQSRLVDAYLTQGHALEARAVAEDLASRTQDPAHVERFRKALEATGEPDPARVIAERLGHPGPLGSPASSADTVGAAGSATLRSPDEVSLDFGGGAAAAASEAVPSGDTAPADPFRLGPIAIDLSGILGESLDEERGRPSQIPSLEADVTERRRAEPSVPPHDAGASSHTGQGARPPAGAKKGDESGDVFADFHDEVAREADAALAEQHYKVGLTYRDMGMVAEAIGELELAVRSPRFRFEAAALLAQLALQRGAVADAIDWYERAAEAPAPSSEAARGLLYELGDTLETGGESARALAVFLELQAEAGDYRDVGRRVERLARVQAGG
jgi:tetratricopeptide (TPR) repeat protein